MGKKRLRVVAPRPRPAGATATRVTAAPPRLTVELLKAFSLASAPGTVRWIEGHGVPAAKVTVQGTTISGTTDANGLVHLPIVGPVAGRVLDIQPPTAQVSSGHAST